MLAESDIGLVPWVPLMQMHGPPEPLLRQCSERIRREGGDKSADMLAVTQSLARLKFEDDGLLDLFTRSRGMIESPWVTELEERVRVTQLQEVIEDLLLDRVGKLSEDGRARLQCVKDREKLRKLLLFAGKCQTLDAFVERLVKETTPPPKPVSTRRKKKS